MSMKIKIIEQSVVYADADIIVNAANSSLLGGGGVDGAIHMAAGPKLLAECRTLGGCKTGDAKITGAYDIKNAKYIIHTVGPIYAGDGTDADFLANCYINSLNLAKEYDCKSIAFPCISTGVYGYPLNDACKVVIAALKKWESENEDYDIEVLLCCFSKREFEAYSKLACPVCNEYFFDGKYDICPVCGWENDPVQYQDPDFEGGANKLSLNEARKRFRK